MDDSIEQTGWTTLGGLARPVILPLLEGRIRSASFAIAGSLQVAAAVAHLPGMPCPILHLFHIPCPGCGVSRACAAIIHGDFARAYRLHAFAPFFLIAIVLCWVAALLPERKREAFVRFVRGFERRTAIPMLLLIAALLYWGLRFMYARDQLTRLING